MNTSFIQVQQKKNYAIISLKRDPVNSMNLDFWKQLTQILQKCENEPKIRGVIFTSGLTRQIFTAGNDINELYVPSSSLERYTQFWTISNQFLANLSKSKLLTIAALNGACPAGGTALALACDFRIASEDTKMGLNEVALGISVPFYWMKLMASVIGQGKTDKLVQFAQMVDAKQGIKFGLVDQVVDTREMVLPAAEMLLRLPDLGRQLTKSALRDDLANEWADEKRLMGESANAFDMLSAPSTVKAIAGVLTRLSKSKI